MKQRLSNFIKNNWIFIFLVIVLQLKSMLLLSMLRTPGSSSINLATMYFGVPAIWVHIAMITLVASIIYLFKGRGQLRAAIIINLIISLLFIADIWYYRNNGTFLSIRHLTHSEIFNPLGKNLFNLKVVDIVFFIDFILLFIVYRFTTIKNFISTISVKGRVIRFVAIFLISIAVIWVSNNYIKQGTSPYALFRIAWAPFQTFSDMSPLGYHGYDLFYYSNGDKELTEEETQKVETWLNNNKEDLPDNKYRGMLQGKNVIALQVESLENFVINQKVNGQEITPTLNKILSESVYLDNIYEQNNSGTSSDCDLLVNTSVFPVRKGSTFFGYPWTEYNSIQKILNKEGYNTISTHAEVPGNWNWSEAHKSFEANQIWDLSYFEEDELIGLGLSDESYLRQMAEKLKDEAQPYYAFIATLTSHGPFHMPEDKKYLDLPKELDENILGAYFQSIRYADESIARFLEDLNKNNQLENTVVMIYGDHGGIHKFYNDDIQDAPLSGDWWKVNDKKIPLIIYNPSIEGEKISNAGGQVDFLPTIAYMLGVDRTELDQTSMGRILVNTERNATILNNGEIVGNPKDENEINHLKEAFKVADLIIQGNYFNKEK